MKDDIEAEMRRLRLELKQTMEMYSSACKEALTARQKVYIYIIHFEYMNLFNIAHLTQSTLFTYVFNICIYIYIWIIQWQARELSLWRMEEEQRLEEARLAEETARSVAEKERAKCRAAMEAAEAAQRIAELESQKRISAEMKAVQESEEKKKALDALAHSDVRYRKYTIEEIEVATEYFSQARKIGEGGYGPVYKCYLDHTQAAIKVLRPDASQGRSQFQQEVRHVCSLL